jgi:hypothetical protein
VAERLIEAWVNPLQILEIDEPWADIDKAAITPEVFLKFLCTPGVAPDAQSLAVRYREISIERTRLFVAPYEQAIMSRLIWPLRHAKAAYTVANYLATIALAGIVAEMMALLLWDVFGSPELEQSAKVKRELGRGSFERADQVRRVKVLRAVGFISADELHSYSRIRKARREHLHLWAQDDTNVARTAAAAYDDAVFIVFNGLGLGIDDGKAILKDKILDYIAKAKAE